MGRVRKRKEGEEELKEGLLRVQGKGEQRI